MSIESAITLRRDGLKERAIKELEEYCILNPCDLDMLTTLRVWKRELREESWTMARRNAYRSSYDSGFIDWSHINEVWAHHFRSSIAQEFLPDIPSPIIAWDMLIIPSPSMDSFLGYLTSDGKEIGSNSILGVRLSYASTPVYINPFLIFATDGAIYGLTLNGDRILSRQVLVDPRIQPMRFNPPIAVRDKAFFTFKDWILIYTPSTDSYRFIPIKLPRSDDLLRSPVLHIDELIFLSRFGEILYLELESCKIHSLRKRTRKLISESIYSPPCLVDSRLYFEFLNMNGLRGIYIYNLAKDEIIMHPIEEEVCSPNDTHLDFPPIGFKEGVLISSDISPRLYYVLPTKVVPIDVRIQTGRLRLHKISHIFSCTLGNRLVGKAPGGFFHLDLLNPTDGTIDIFRPATEVISQPLNYGNRLFFVNKDGARCLSIR